MEVQDRRGIRMELGEAIKRGGEAQIFEVRDQPNLVAKIYHAHRYDEPKEAKLKAMLANAPMQPATHTAIAWPIELLYQRGRLVGFLMPKIEGYDPIVKFYNPARRKRQLPGFNRKHLHRIAINLAVAINNVHQSGHLIGDLNESNVLVNDQALVALVDADSFQIAGPKGQIYRCPVGKPEYTPPELQGARFDQVNRRPEHDHFALAVLIFQLLMEGYHPFSAVLPSDLSVKRVDVYAIKLGLFAYYQNHERFSAQKPPKAPSLTRLPPNLQALFIRCFFNGYHHPMQRPTARQWQMHLQKAEQGLQPCPRRLHIYSNHLTTCPNCEPLAPKAPSVHNQKLKSSRRPARRSLPGYKMMVAGFLLLYAHIFMTTYLLQISGLNSRTNSAPSPDFRQPPASETVVEDAPSTTQTTYPSPTTADPSPTTADPSPTYQPYPEP